MTGCHDIGISGTYINLFGTPFALYLETGLLIPGYDIMAFKRGIHVPTDRFYAIYNADIQKAQVIFKDSSAAAKYVYGVGNGKKIYGLAHSKTKMRQTGVILPYRVAIRFATNEQIELLGENDHIILDENTVPVKAVILKTMTTGVEDRAEFCRIVNSVDSMHPNSVTGIKTYHDRVHPKAKYDLYQYKGKLNLGQTVTISVYDYDKMIPHTDWNDWYLVKSETKNPSHMVVPNKKTYAIRTFVPKAPKRTTEQVIADNEQKAILLEQEFKKVFEEGANYPGLITNCIYRSNDARREHWINGYKSTHPTSPLLARYGI